jgi:polyadenylate-binding protein
MEESKQVPIIITVIKTSSLTDADIKDYLSDNNAHVEAITSPKGFKILVSTEKAEELLAKEVDTLKGEKIYLAEDDPFCTLFVKGITSAVDESDLNTALSVEGRICMVSILRNVKHQPVGSAFVRFNKKDDALRAAENHKELTVNEVKLSVEIYKPKQSKPKSSINESASFKNVPSSYSEQDVFNMLSQHGPIANLEFNADSGTGTVSFSSHGCVTRAIQALNGTKLLDSTFIITDNSEGKKTKAAQYNNLYVGNVDFNVTEQELRDEFSKFGEIESLLRPTRQVKTQSGETKKVNKNHIFVSFKDSVSASNVIKEMDGRTHWGRTLDINYYDPEAKYGPNAKTKKTTQIDQEELAQNFMNMMSMMVSTMSGNMRGNRGGYGGQNRGNYRGGNNYGRGSRGSRGMPRGGMRGAPPHPGAKYNQVRSQYEKPVMQPYMAPPPAATYNTMEHQMGYNPPMPTNMAPPAMQAPKAPEPQPKEPENGLGVTLEQLNNMEKDEQENILGTFLYNKLEPLRGGEVAGKITGMFLDLPTNEIYEIATVDATFQKYLKDAIDLIENEDPE